MSLTAHVDPAIELIEHRFRSGPGATGLAYLRSHAYFNQLSPADACLDSFLGYELDPSAVRPLGGNGDGSLGVIVGRDEAFAVPLRRAVAAVITSGYLTMLSIEDPPGSDWVPNRDAEALWRFWVSHLRPTGILALGIPAELAESVGRDGGAHLEAEIARLGLKPGNVPAPGRLPSVLGARQVRPLAPRRPDDRLQRRRVRARPGRRPGRVHALKALAGRPRRNYPGDGASASSSRLRRSSSRRESRVKSRENTGSSRLAGPWARN